MGLFKIIKAAITPGIHPQTVSIKTINTDPQPLPITASGGKRIASRTFHILIPNKSTIIFKKVICEFGIHDFDTNFKFTF